MKTMNEFDKLLNELSKSSGTITVPAPKNPIRPETWEYIENLKRFEETSRQTIIWCDEKKQ